MDETQWLSQLGVGGILAGMLLYFYRKDVKSFTDLWKVQAELLIRVVQENTSAITKNTETISALHRREDRIEEALAERGIQIVPFRTIDRDAQK